MSAKTSILVVDDDESWLELCVLMLQAQDLDVTPARDGAEALRRIAERPFDIVLTDLVMPEPNDGRAVVFGVKARRPETDCILMTATPSLESAIAVLKDGAYDYIVKPFKQETLALVLGRCLEKRSARAELSAEKQLREELQAAYAELKRTEKLKEGFLARVSHELNTPLASILMAMDLIESALQGQPKNAGRLKMARDAADRLQAVIADLLDFVDLQKPGLELKPEPVAVEPLLREILGENERLIQSKGLRISTDFPAGLACVPGDARLLKRALRQLVLNAIHFNRQGGLLELKASIWEDRFVLSVRDEGEGIALDRQGEIFDSFYQIADYMTRKVGGLGLGLSIVKKIIEAHRGTIAVESEPAQGSKFRVSLPLG